MGDYCCGRTRRLGLTPGRAGQPATGLTYQPYSYSGGAVPLASADAAAYYAGYSMLKPLSPAQNSSLQLQEDSATNNLGLSGITQAISQNLGTSIATNFFNGRANEQRDCADALHTGQPAWKLLVHEPRSDDRGAARVGQSDAVRDHLGR